MFVPKFNVLLLCPSPLLRGIACSAALALLLASCSGGGSDPAASGGGSSSSVSGFLSKGPITGATCNLFNSANQLVSTSTTDKGQVSFGSAIPAGAYTASCTGGTYLDEATGLTVTNTTVLRSGVVVGGGGAAVMTVSPLTEMAYQSAGGDASKIDAAAKAIAKAFGLPDSVNLLTTVPTDVNTKAAANDAAGQYGTLLAAIAQLQKDQGSSLSSVITTLSGGINTTGSSPTLNAAVASLLSGAAANLTDPSKNSNPAVQGFVAATKGVVQLGVTGSADGTPFANSILLSGLGSSATVTAPVFGQTYTVAVTGGNLGAASLVATNMACGSATVSATSISATCVMAGYGTQAGVAVQSGGVNVQGLVPSVQWFLGTSGQSCKLGAIVTALSPTTFSYGAQNVAVTVQGCSLATAATLAMDGQTCALSTGGTSSQLQFLCNVPNTRLVSNAGNLVLATYGTANSLTTPITYNVPKVNANSASPSTLGFGAYGSSNWLVNGNGLFTGMTVSLDKTTCASSGTANASGTQLTGVDCSNAQASLSGSTALLGVGAAQVSIGLTALPIPVIGVAGASTVAVGGSTQLLPLSASGGAFSYSIVSDKFIGSVDGSGNVTSAAAGVVSVLVSQAEVPGQYAAANATVNINFSALSVPAISFTTNPKKVTWGDADFTNAATASCAGANYSSIKYGVTAGSSVASVDAAGKVVLMGAGFAIIEARVPAVGTCAAQAVSYALTVNKAVPVLTFGSPATSMVLGATGPTNAVTVSPPANNGSGGVLPSTGNLTLTYSSGTPAVATVDNLGNISAVKAGTTVIGASSASDANYQKGSATGFTFTVQKASVTVTVALTAGLKLNVGSTIPVQNTGTLVGALASPAPTGAIAYSSGDPTVATVDASGNVKAAGAGTTVINVNYAGDANYNAAAAISYPVTVSVFVLGETSGAASDGMSFVYTGLPGADLTALQAFDFNGGAKTLYWQPKFADGGIPDASNPNTDVFLKNMGYDDRIIIRVSSGVIPEPETGGTYPNVRDPYGTYPAGITFSVSNAAVVNQAVVTSVPQNPQRGYDYVRWTQRYFTGLIGTPGGLNDGRSQYPYDQYTYYNDRAVPGFTWGKFEITAGYEVPQQILDSDGVTVIATVYNPTIKTITLSGFPTYYNPFVPPPGFPYSPSFSVTYYNGFTDPGGCQGSYGPGPNYVLLGFFCGYASGSGGDPYGGPRPGYDQTGNFITFRP